MVILDRDCKLSDFGTKKDGNCAGKFDNEDNYNFDIMKMLMMKFMSIVKEKMIALTCCSGGGGACQPNCKFSLIFYSIPNSKNSRIF